MPAQSAADRAAWLAQQDRERQELLAAVSQPVHLHFFGLEDGSDDDEEASLSGVCRSLCWVVLCVGALCCPCDVRCAVPVMYAVLHCDVRCAAL